MLGRLPWFAFERRRRALRLLVFFDIGLSGYGSRGDPPTALSARPQADIKATAVPRPTLGRIVAILRPG